MVQAPQSNYSINRTTYAQNLRGSQGKRTRVLISFASSGPSHERLFDFLCVRYAQKFDSQLRIRRAPDRKRPFCHNGSPVSRAVARHGCGRWRAVYGPCVETDRSFTAGRADGDGREPRRSVASRQHGVSSERGLFSSVSGRYLFGCGFAASRRGESSAPFCVTGSVPEVAREPMPKMVRSAIFHFLL